jgi:hypothetical protein
MSETNAISGTGHVRSGGLLGGREATGQQSDVHPAGAPLAGRSMADGCFHDFIKQPDGTELCWKCGAERRGHAESAAQRSDPANTELSSGHE